MRRRSRWIAALLAAAGLASSAIIQLASAAQGDNPPDAYTQIVNGQIAGQPIPIQPNGAPTYIQLGWGRYYTGPNGLEIRLNSNGTINLVKFALTVESLGLGGLATGTATTVGDMVLSSISTASIRNALTVANVLFGATVADTITNMVLRNLCLGVTVPSSSIGSLLTRATSFAGGQYVQGLLGSVPDQTQVWLESCSMPLPGPADILVPISIPGIQDVLAPNPSAGSGVGNSVYDGRDFLRSSDALTLQAGHYIMSVDARFVFILQTDGNLVLYGPGYVPVWASGTSGYPIDHLTMQPDGNLVLYGLGGYPMWWTGSSGGPSHLTIQPDGNAVIYTDPGAVVTWQSRTQVSTSITAFGSDHLGSNQTLQAGQYLQSGDKRYDLVMQTDGNLVLYGPGGHATWQSQTSGAGNRLVMQPDGNLVIYSSSNAALWYITAHGGVLAPGGYFKLQSDGNAVVLTTGNTPTWNSGTSGAI